MANDDAPDPQKIMKLARQANSSGEYRRKFHMADFWTPKEFYEPQLHFFGEGGRRHQRLIRGGNQVGKSFACAFELALHLTGHIRAGGGAGSSTSRSARGLSASLRSSCVTARSVS
jgi:hypothetical protein